MSDRSSSQRPRLRVVQGGREDAPRSPPNRPAGGPRPVDVDASFVSEHTVGAAVDATVRPAPKALLAAREDQVPKDMPEETGRRLAPGAPLSPGTVPLELALHLRTGEALVWWDAKAAVDLRATAVVLAACALVLLGVTIMAPDFWAQPFADLWPPVAALLSPALLLLLREHLSLRSLLVTDTAIVEVTRRGAVSRLVFSAIRVVRRDLLTGGVLLQGKNSKIRVPPALVQNARAAIVSQRRNVLRGEATPPDDPLRWMP